MNFRNKERKRIRRRRLKEKGMQWERRIKKKRDRRKGWRGEGG